MEDPDIEFLIEDALFWLNKIRTDRKPTQADIQRAADLADEAINFLQTQNEFILSRFDGIERLNQRMAGFVNSIEVGLIGHA